MSNGPVRQVARLHDMWAVRRQRKVLAQMDQHRLDDLGLSPRDAAFEAGRPFWDVPDYWRR